MPVDHYENFPVASILCPPALRPAVTAIYWFARTADDLADEGQATSAQRLQDLQAYGQTLQAIAQGQAPGPRWHAVFMPLQAALQTHQLPVPLLQDLLSAFAQDVTPPTYPDRASLLDYCQRSANPIGRLLLHLYGIHHTQALAQSDHICTALQLINFWQDLSIDVPRGRFYVPLQDSLRHGVDESALRAGHNTPATQNLIKDLVDWAEQLMHAGAPLARALPGRAGWELRLVVQGGLAIARKIKQMNYTTLTQRPRLRWHDSPVIVWHALYPSELKKLYRWLILGTRLRR